MWSGIIALIAAAVAYLAIRAQIAHGRDVEERTRRMRVQEIRSVARAALLALENMAVRRLAAFEQIGEHLNSGRSRFYRDVGLDMTAIEVPRVLVDQPMAFGALDFAEIGNLMEAISVTADANRLLSSYKPGVPEPGDIPHQLARVNRIVLGLGTMAEAVRRALSAIR